MVTPLCARACRREAIILRGDKTLDPSHDFIDGMSALRRKAGVMAELSIFYCEEAFRFLESCSMEDETYFAALIRMYGRSLEFLSSLPAAERATYLERLDKLRSRARNVGWGVEEELNGLWYAAALDEHHQGE
jgi:hypothetical protein